MSYPLSLDLQHKQATSLKQMQRLIMSPQMQQALHLLQAPVMELANLIEIELQQNPCLEIEQEEDKEEAEYRQNELENRENSEEINGIQEKEISFDEHDFAILRQIDEDFRDYIKESGSYQPPTKEDDKLQTYIESSIQAPSSLFDYLMQQAHDTFVKSEDLAMAEALIGNLDEKGFLKVTLKEISQLNQFKEEQLKPILKEIQTFEPYGIGATSLQESLLIQLTCVGKEKKMAFKIIRDYYDDLIHNRIPLIQKGLHLNAQQIKEAIHQDIAKLDLHPGTLLSHEPIQTIIPDITLMIEEGKAIITVNHDYLPSFRFNRRYLKMLEDETLNVETKNFIRQKILSARWLMKNVHQRHDTLEKIVKFLSENQLDFFSHSEGKFMPMTMKMVAEELDLHESTIARAVAGKYIHCPRGLIALRSFFTNAYTDAEGKDISSQTVRDVLREIIHQEDKIKPLSDESIAEQLKLKGISCARRTIAKYRSELQIGNAHQRRQY